MREEPLAFVALVVLIGAVLGACAYFAAGGVM